MAPLLMANLRRFQRLRIRRSTSKYARKTYKAFNAAFLESLGYVSLRECLNPALYLQNKLLMWDFRQDSSDTFTGYVLKHFEQLDPLSLRTNRIVKPILEFGVWQARQKDMCKHYSRDQKCTRWIAPLTEHAHHHTHRFTEGRKKQLFYTSMQDGWGL